MAMHQLSDSLSHLGHEVRILAMNTHKQSFDEKEWDEDYVRKFRPEQVFIDTRLKRMDAARNLFSAKSYNIERFHSQAFSDKLAQILSSEKFDIIQLESIYVASYLPVIRKYSQAKVVLRAHNIEHLIWERIAGWEQRSLRKKYLKMLAQRLRIYELAKLNEFDAIAAITPGDAAFFRNNGCTKPVEHIPFGITLKPLLAVPVRKKSLFFIGAMDWLPNQETVKWVLENVWEELRDLYPTIQLHIAGRNMPDWLLSLKTKNVMITSDVPDADAFMADKAILLAPFFSGGGMRVKFIEAMAQQKIVITTSIGAEGIDGHDGEHFMIAESFPAIIGAIDKCFNEPEFVANVGANARNLVAEKYDSARIAEKLVGLYKSLI
jgi:glycosyltransferase involved in cell wall biosynthesis